MLSVRQAAKVLGISCNLVYALCARKRIRHERHGLGRGTIKIAEDAIDAYRQSVTIEPVEEERPAPLAKGKAGLFKHLNAERLQKAWTHQ